MNIGDVRKMIIKNSFNGIHGVLRRLWVISIFNNPNQILVPIFFDNTFGIAAYLIENDSQLI